MNNDTPEKEIREAGTNPESEAETAVADNQDNVNESEDLSEKDTEGVDEEDTENEDEDNHYGEIDEDTKQLFESGRASNLTVTYFNGPINAPVTSGGDMSLGQSHNPFSSSLKEAAFHLSEFYVPHGFEKQLSDRLRQEYVILLTGADHTGKYSTALYTLHAMQSADIHQLLPTIDLEELLKMTIERDTAYVIDSLAVETAEKLKEHNLDYLARLCRENNSCFIITVNAERLEEVPAHHQFKMAPALRPVEWFSNHLDHNMNLSIEETEKIEHTLTNEKISELVSRPREASALVTRLSEIVMQGDDIDTFLQSTESDAGDHVEQWLQEKRGMDVLTFALSLSIFSGMPYEDIRNYAGSLRHHLFTRHTKRLENPVSTGRKMLLDQVNGQIFSEPVHKEFGVVNIDCARYRDRFFGDYVLYYVWQNHIFEKDHLIEWILEQFNAEPKQTRPYIARACASLIQTENDFRTMKEKVIHPLAKSGHFMERALAGDILVQAGQTKEFLPLAGRLVRSWILNPNENLNWTACYVYGSSIRGSLFQEALRELTDLNLTRSTPELRHASLISLQNLLHSGEDQPVLLDHFLSYTAECFELYSEDPKMMNRFLTLYSKILHSVSPELLAILLGRSLALRYNVAPVLAFSLTHRKQKTFTEALFSSWLNSVPETNALKEDLTYLFTAVYVELTKTGNTFGVRRFENWLKNRFIQGTMDQKDVLYPIIKKL
ncbi:hypothetical protein [Alteribacter natronophilus]|uniref:hypothetical protein n=1 Tax=Alteribacter natronophilus TaxID=2583810 RepID=UPI00110DA987|nr:hypothetical protein [Alteribacter natronophilus]TMW72305.1 hypothetical protein FGB90_08840 [Alteribacter natronophilus]